ncbi:hypothetical protein T03_10169 [Trichinella britovi]|uniref:Secreted protein n=1 Tax=Trichinella britovi TaxID=45882 RepID=A0A0V1DIJ4_TRIBR|nr:hypothetical protein T03_10169 [Trichinella britovi]
MRYLIFLCASGTTLGGSVRDPTVSGGVRSAGPQLANSHLLMLEPNFFSFLQSPGGFADKVRAARMLCFYEIFFSCRFLHYYAGVSRKHLSLKHLTGGKILPVARVGFFLLYCNTEPADPHGRHHF